MLHDNIMIAQQPKRTVGDHIHSETYGLRYNFQNLNHDTMLCVAGRPREQLNGLWYFTVDPYDTGLRKDWYARHWTDIKDQGVPWDYESDQGEIHAVPSCWNMQKPEYFYYEGSAWYSREFTYEAETPDERVFLRVGAASYDAMVFLNQEYLGNHYGASTPFFVEFTGKLGKNNQLQICVNNARTLDRIPMRNTDWFNYGGLYRDVELIRVPNDFIKDFRVWLVPNNAFNEIGVAITVSDESAQDAVTIQLPELGIEHALPLTNGRAEATIHANPELWSPETPKLYNVTAQFRHDTVSDHIGFRQISVEGTTVQLNGAPIFLRGISVHEDDEKLGKATNKGDILRRFRHAKELGCNFLRLAHYPHHAMAAQLADELGLLLWEEIPVYWAIDFEHEATYKDAENQLTELISRDFNRASVIIWSVGNENADTEPRFNFMSGLARTAKRLDPSRLVSAACLVNHEKNAIEDRLTEELDIIGLNEYYGWYDPSYEKLIQLGENSNPDKPVIISETGAGALAGHHGSKTDRFTEEYMEEVYKKQIDVIRTLDYIKGISPWILYDFRASRRFNRFQKGWNRKGLIADDKQTRKLAFSVLQQFYQEKAEEEN